MTRDELVTRLNLLPPLPDPVLPAQARPAAVLMPLVEGAQGLELVFTRRSRWLRHHPGQVSFPGGRVDEGDPSLWFTALRESEEEIGLEPGRCRPLGRLRAQYTVSGFALTPFVGLVEGQPRFILNPAEVDEVFQVPLGYLLDFDRHYLYRLYRRGRVHTVCFIPWHNTWIWGVTAAIIHQFALQIAR
ncbi:CoA pyrophosphatase [Zobellella endophytica]|uniref:CoA pyrophosphatase n=1 Tax=Zobellella endophytica TaxID=2116700 RepID=A0A2P7RC23_9GAMM|nr:CoA pyrophosphatase [Zobellella endophytica]PSJ47786.1 CoA pyrophosphatase [Zobellella endophytica]